MIPEALLTVSRRELKVYPHNFQTCTLTHSFLYSNKIDEPLLLTRYEIPGIPQDYYYHTDALGNITTLTDTTNKVTEYVQYDPYGNPHFFDTDSNPIAQSTINNPKLFTGRDYDSETNLYYYRARFYSPNSYCQMLWMRNLAPRILPVFLSSTA